MDTVLEILFAFVLALFGIVKFIGLILFVMVGPVIILGALAAIFVLILVFVPEFIKWARTPKEVLKAKELAKELAEKAHADAERKRAADLKAYLAALPPSEYVSSEEMSSCYGGGGGGCKPEDLSPTQSRDE
jgi:hypothetical protein